jgi:chaperone BCS1
VAGAISLWGLTVVTYLFKTTPTKIWRFLKRQLTTTLEIDNAQNSSGFEMIFEEFMYLFGVKINTLSRVYTVCDQSYMGKNGERCFTKGIAPGYGGHFFIFDRKLMWLNVSRIESSGSEKQKRAMTVTYLGRSTKTVKKLTEQFIVRKNPYNHYFTYREDYWAKENIIRNRPLESVAVDESIVHNIKNDITHFGNNEGWFVAKGVPYKLTYMLHGTPGTGKTSLIKAIACHFKKDIYIINLNAMTDSRLTDALDFTKPGAIVVMEDIDCVKSSSDRTVKDNNKSDSIMPDFLSLSGLLNALDGLRSLHNVIIFMTTNHLNKLDKALYRPGRVDRVIELGEVSPDRVRSYSNYIFPEHKAKFKEVDFGNLIGCELNKALLISKNDPEKYIKVLLDAKKHRKSVPSLED